MSAAHRKGHGVAEMTWRQGRKQPRNIYMDDRYVGVIFNEAEARLIVATLNDDIGPPSVVDVVVVGEDWKARAERAEAERDAAIERAQECERIMAVERVWKADFVADLTTIRDHWPADDEWTPRSSLGAEAMVVVARNYEEDSQADFRAGIEAAAKAAERYLATDRDKYPWPNAWQNRSLVDIIRSLTGGEP
jgi:hypothetical protein